MLLFGTAFRWISTVAVDTSYATTIVPQMVLMGLGMGLISTPATESILLVLPPARAGVGSAVNDATRELGGTLGVAVVGSLFSSVYAGHCATPPSVGCRPTSWPAPRTPSAPGSRSPRPTRAWPRPSRPPSSTASARPAR